MRLLKHSKEFILFFSELNKKINNKNITNQTKDIFKELYYLLLYSHNCLKKKGEFYKVSVKKISHAGHIIKPKMFSEKYIPKDVLNYIHSYSLTEILFEFSLYERDIKVYFTIEEHYAQHSLKIYKKYIESIIMWLYVLNHYSSKKCSKSLVVYFYFTSHKKFLPKNSEIIDEINVNTGFTTTCPLDSEIVIYRKEEWFKVFIHETFHNFGLDFSGMNNKEVKKCILDIFIVNSEVNLYESYTEFWAEIINALFCSFHSIKDKTNINDFMKYAELYIKLERSFGFFQLVKTLNHMGLCYTDLFFKKDKYNNGNSKSKMLYREKTNVLSYYIIKTIMMNNYQGFLNWCKINNFSLLQFKQTIQSQREFCVFVHNNYKTTSMLKNILESENYFKNIHSAIHKSKKTKEILSNLRMTICELG